MKTRADGGEKASGDGRKRRLKELQLVLQTECPGIRKGCELMMSAEYRCRLDLSL